MPDQPEHKGVPARHPRTHTARHTLQVKFKGGRSASVEVRTAEAAGLAARDLALAMLLDVLDHKRSFDDAIARTFSSSKGLALDPRDRGLARTIAATVLRRKGMLEQVLARFMEKPLAPKYEDANRIMLAGVAQILYLDTPPHAAVSLAVSQTRARPTIQHLAKLVNAVLRRVAICGRELLGDSGDAGDALSTFPEWLASALQRAYVASPGMPNRIAEACLQEAPLDLTIKDPARTTEWAERLNGVVLSTGTVRLASGGRIEDREGYGDGAWWVQDAAAALPARLFGDDVTGLDIVDLCAAPGGKTAQLAARGAKVAAVDISAARLKRVSENLQRLVLFAEIVESDALLFKPAGTFDAVLLDAPCSATGTIRRHPDILHLKDQKDVDTLVRIQSRLLDHAAGLVRPGGTLVFCTCSLLPAEGEHRIQGFLAKHRDFLRRPIEPREAGIEADWITADGDLRTLPVHTPPGDKELHGMDGFFAARLVRNA